MKFPVAKFLCQPCLSLGLALTAAAAVESPGWSLLPAVQVDATGIFLDQIVAGATAETPHIRLAPAPVANRAVTFTTAQINDLLQQSAPELVSTNWRGAAQVKISRRTRSLRESEIKELLVASLQQNYVKDRGELELRFSRPVPAAIVIDEPLTVKLLELPSTGVTANFIARFELRAGEEVAGTWQIPVTANIWREVYVASSALKRGQLVRDADLSRERRDMLALRDALTTVELDNPYLELSENVPAGMALNSRSLRLRPIVNRGKIADAIVRDGPLTVSVKVEILEDGLPGQTIRVRNLKSKREFRGKVQNEETIHVTL
jgi:flagella basal body P-ring formation protein FlgA